MDPEGRPVVDEKPFNEVLRLQRIVRKPWSEAYVRLHEARDIFPAHEERRLASILGTSNI